MSLLLVVRPGAPFVASLLPVASFFCFLLAFLWAKCMLQPLADHNLAWSESRQVRPVLSTKSGKK